VEKLGVATRVQTAITMSQVASRSFRVAPCGISKGQGGYLAAARAILFFYRHGGRAAANEIGAESSEATKVDGIYDSDPKRIPPRSVHQNHTLRPFKTVKVMDSTAFSLCMDNKMPIIRF